MALPLRRHLRLEAVSSHSFFKLSGNRFALRKRVKQKSHPIVAKASSLSQKSFG
jgi:hypothetical protein